MSVKQIISDTPNLVLDTSVLLSYFMNEARDINSLLDDYVFTQESKIILYGHNLIKTELLYVICREKDMTEAEMVLKKTEGIMNIISDTWLFKKAANIKCRYPSVLCFSFQKSNYREKS